MKIADLTTIVKNTPRPILLVDTCAFLDILRLPYRALSPEIAKTILADVLTICSMLYENKMYLAIPEIVKSEFQDNLPIVFMELKKHLGTLEKHYNINAEMTNVLNEKSSCPVFSPSKLAESLMSRCNQLIDLWAFILQEEDSIKLVAYARSIAGLAPAQKGKQSLKDCAVYETVLLAATEIRNVDKNVEICFISSNTRDFGYVGNLPDNIKNDFSRLNIGFSNTWNHTWFLLKSSVARI